MTTMSGDGGDEKKKKKKNTFNGCWDNPTFFQGTVETLGNSTEVEFRAPSFRIHFLYPRKRRLICNVWEFKVVLSRNLIGENEPNRELSNSQVNYSRYGGFSHGFGIVSRMVKEEEEEEKSSGGTP
ncbi:hypothetical protein RUM44_009449 [Polyplax serrata]|uniref:Uncharacterized protein n=1 Tax=Polyplax serrata TaxID=468196 RepID=A0ABR1AUF1_POLSC